MSEESDEPVCLVKILLPFITFIILKGFILFGRDVSKIPCFRNSFYYGITSGLVLGLGHFMITSQPRKSTNFGMYSFTLVTLAYWIQCRVNYSKQRFEMLKLQELLEKRAIYEGTEKDIVLPSDSKPVEI